MLLFALPVLLGNIFQQLYNAFDSWVVGQFLGDTAHDAEVARAIGCRCYLISGGHQEDAVLAQARVPVLRSLRELYPILGV